MKRVAWIALLGFSQIWAAEGVIEQQLKKIGSIPNEEVFVVQRQFTSKTWRHEFSPIEIGGIAFDTVRRTLLGRASYTLHLNDWLAWEAVGFTYNRSYFSSFIDDVNQNQALKIAPDYQKLIYFLTTAVQWTPTYGKVSTFSRWIAYLEPYFVLGTGLAKSEVNEYLTVFPGIGARFFFKEWFSMRVELRDYLVTERVTNRKNNTKEEALRNNYAVMVGLSFWLPKMPR